MPPPSPYKLYWQNIRKHALAYSIGLVAMLITSLSEVFLPKFIQWSLDLLYKPHQEDLIPKFFYRGDSHSTLDFLILCLLAVLVLGWLGRIGWRQVLARQTHLAGHEIKTKIWSVLKDQPLSLLDKYSLGDLMNRSTADWNKTRFIHGFTLVLTFDLVFFSVLSVISMLLIDVELAILSLIIIPFLPKRIIKISKEEYRQHQSAQEQLSSLSDLISQSIKTIRLQRATATESAWIDKLNRDANEYAVRQFEVLRTSWKIFIWGAIPTLIAYSVLFTFGIWKVSIGELSLGGFIALQSYILLLQSPLFELGSLISEWQTGFASYYRITELYKLEKKPANSGKIPDSTQCEYAIEINRINYSYEDDKQVLTDICLSLRPGEKIGLIGPIGGGKTTLLNLVAGLAENIPKAVEVFGVPVCESGRDWIVSHITMVPQKPFLFAGSVRHNLDPTGCHQESRMIEALKSVELWQDVQTFPQGLETWIGESGINLSGGQKQRLSLARALMKNCPILLIDDALSAVDSVTESRILSQIHQTVRDKTIIWTAHRISTLQLCEKVYRLEKGQLEMLSPNNSYRTTHFSQNSDLVFLETHNAQPST